MTEVGREMLNKIMRGEMTPSEALWNLLGRRVPARNDCGFPGRYDLEDTSRMFGWGPEEGEGPCDYPAFCPFLRERGACPFFVWDSPSGPSAWNR